MPDGSAWVRIKGSGRVIQGACLIHGVIFWPASDADWVGIYDGLDTTSGKKFCVVEAAKSTTWTALPAEGVRFEHGCYVDAIDSGVETTILYTPLE